MTMTMTPQLVPLQLPKQLSSSSSSSSSSSIILETLSLFHLSFPIALTALLLYSRSVISMLFLGSLGDLPLAAGSLAIAFANISGYSLLSGLSLGMEPLCSQSFGANHPKLLLLTLYRSIIFLLCCSLPISITWLNMSNILTKLFGQDDQQIVDMAQTYLLFCLPDLLSFSFLHPIRIYLRSQGITRPLTVTTFVSALLHLPLNFILIDFFDFGVAGVAAASAASNFALLVLLLGYLHKRDTWHVGPTKECLSGWGPLARLAAPSCVSVCLEWWWYEFMIILCGLLPDPKPAIASMGILIQTTALIYVFPSSLGFGVSTRVGNELGANRPDKARNSANVAVLIGGLTGFVAMGFATIMRNEWGKMFTNDEEILRLTAAALPIVGLCELGNSPQTVGCGVLRGTARPAHAAHINFGAFYLVGMPVGAFIGFGLRVGFCGFWVGLLAAQVSCAGLMLYKVGTTDWEAQARRAQVLTCAGGGGEGAEHVTGGDDVDDGRKGEKCYEPLVSIKVLEIER